MFNIWIMFGIISINFFGCIIFGVLVYIEYVVVWEGDLLLFVLICFLIWKKYIYYLIFKV